MCKSIGKRHNYVKYKIMKVRQSSWKISPRHSNVVSVFEIDRYHIQDTLSDISHPNILLKFDLYKKMRN